MKLELNSTAICLLLATNNININSLLEVINGGKQTKFMKVQVYLLTRYSNMEHAAEQEAEEQILLEEILGMLETDLPNLVDILTKQEVKSQLKRPLEEGMLKMALDLENAEKHNYMIRLPQVLMRLVSFSNFAQLIRFMTTHQEHFHQYETRFIKSYFQTRQPTSAQLCLMLEIFEKSPNTTSYLRFVEDLRRNRHIHINQSVMSSSNARRLLQILHNKINDPAV